MRPRAFHARVVQHECDHLDGILYPQRMTDLSSASGVRLGAAPSESRLTNRRGGRDHGRSVTGIAEPEFERSVRSSCCLPPCRTSSFDGWTGRRDPGRRRGPGLGRRSLALNAFPGGAAELIEAYSAWADRAHAGETFEPVWTWTDHEGCSEQGRSSRGQSPPRSRSSRRTGKRCAAEPGFPRSCRRNSTLGLKCLYRTVDAIWYAAGDRSTDYNFYTKRLLLAGVVSSTLLCWLNDRSEGHAETWAFLDRRISQVVRVGGRLGKGMKGLLDLPERLLRRRGGGRRYGTG